MLISPRSKLSKKMRKWAGLPQVQPDTRIAVWEQSRLLYVRNPKCANSSIIGSIADARLGRAPHTDIMGLGREWTSFSFVRNPWARIVSTYQDKASPEVREWRTNPDNVRGFLDAGIPVDKDMSFEEFVELACDLPDDATEKHLRSQTAVLMRRGKPIVSFIGRVENIREDWTALMERTGLNHPLLHLNRSGGGHYSDYFRDQSLVNRVGDRYAEDVRVFNYDFVRP